MATPEAATRPRPGQTRGKLKVLITVRHPVGGIRTFLRYVHARFDPAKYAVSIIAPDSPERDAMRSDFAALAPAYYPLPFNPSPARFISHLFRAVRTERPNVIHSQGLTAGAFSSLVSAVTRTPHVVTLHDVFLPSFFAGLSGRVRRLLLAFVLRLPDRIHCVSQDVRDNLLEFVPRLSGSANRILVIQNGIEIARFANVSPRSIRAELGLAPNTFLLGFFGRFMPQKGFKYLVDAIAILLKESSLPRPLVVLTFSNDGFYREEQAQVRQLGLERHFRFLAFEPNIGPILADIDAIAVPSLWEASSLLSMEAMVVGVPVIGTDCIGLREVLHDTPSRRCPAKDGAALAREILGEMVASTKSAALQFKSEAARRFDVRKRAVEIEALLQSVASQARPPAIGCAT